MFLYDKSKSTIDVYSMTPNDARLTQYRQSEMDKHIPTSERVYIAGTNNDKPLEAIGNPIDARYLNYTGILQRNFFRPFHTFNVAPISKEEQSRLLNSFFEGMYSENGVARIRKGNEIIQYMLLTNKKYSDTMNSHMQYIMNDIISIPASLYLLQMLEQGQFMKALGEDIEEQMHLFDISQDPIQRLSIDELERMYQTQLLTGSIDDVMSKVATTQKILEVVKK